MYHDYHQPGGWKTNTNIAKETRVQGYCCSDKKAPDNGQKIEILKISCLNWTVEANCLDQHHI